MNITKPSMSSDDTWFVDDDHGPLYDLKSMGGWVLAIGLAATAVIVLVAWRALA